MSSRRHSGSHDSYSPEPIVVERNPEVRKSYRIVRPKVPPKKSLTIGSKLYNLFRIRKKKVQFIHEAPVRSRREHRESRTPSSPSPSPPPPPPSPPRGPYRRMTTRLDEEDIFAPLPPKLPPKSKAKYPLGEPFDYIVEERKPQKYRKVKIIHAHPDDQDAHPKVESPTSPHRKRDSGKHFIETRFDDRPTSAWAEHDRRRQEDEVRQLTADFNNMLAKERRERVEAEKAAALAEDKAHRLEVDLAHERRQRSLEKRERDIAERQMRLNQEHERLVEVRRPVVIHNPIPASSMLPAHDTNRTSALNRAQDDYRRRSGVPIVESPVREEARPGTGDRRARRHSIIIVDDQHDRANRDRGHGRR